MSSQQTTKSPTSSDTIHCTNIFQFFKMRVIFTGAKNIASKIKSARIFHFRSSTYISFEEWEAKYMAENHNESDTGPSSGMSGQEVEEGILAKVIQMAEGAQSKTAEREQMFSYRESSKTSVGNVSISAFDSTYEGYCVNAGNEAGISNIQPPLDVTTVKQIRRVCQKLQSKTQCDSPSKDTTPADAFVKSDAEYIEKLGISSSVLHS